MLVKQQSEKANASGFAESLFRKLRSSGTFIRADEHNIGNEQHFFPLLCKYFQMPQSYILCLRTKKLSRFVCRLPGRYGN